MADALKKDPLAPIIPLVIKGREFGLAFTFNTFDFYEAAMEELCGRLPPDGEAYNMLEALAGMAGMQEYLDSVKSARHLLAIDAARAKGVPESEIGALQAPDPTPLQEAQDGMRAFRFVSMRKIHSVAWAAANEGERIKAKQSGSKWIQIDIHDFGRLLDLTNVKEVLHVIMYGYAANSPRPGEVEESPNGDRPLPQIVIDPGEPKSGPSLVPEAALGSQMNSLES